MSLEAYARALRRCNQLHERIQAADGMLPLVDELCHNQQIEKGIHEVKALDRDLVLALRNYYSLLATDLLRRYALELRDDRDQVVELHASAAALLARVTAADSWLPDLYKLKCDLALRLAWFETSLWFLPRLRSNKPFFDRWVSASFGDWFVGERSLHSALQAQATEVERWLLQVPNHAFSQLLPPQPDPELAQRDELADCALGCGTERPWRVRFCHQCSSANLICYDCFRGLAWSRQHDEHRAFAEPRSVPCPFCRAEYSLGSAYTLLTQRKHKPKRQKVL